MVPLNECARVSHCASFAYAQDLGRFLKRLVNLAPNVSGATIPDSADKNRTYDPVITNDVLYH